MHTKLSALLYVSILAFAVAACRNKTITSDTSSESDTATEPDTDTTVPLLCGNGVLDPGEDCDTEVGGQVCDDLPTFVDGTLACSAQCEFDTSACVSASDWLEAARTAADGAGLALPVAKAYVTVIRPAVGNDPAGFFVQAEMGGAALFVSIDPGTLAPVPAVGDEVGFTITEMGSIAEGGLRHAVAISGWTVTSSGFDVSSLVEDLSSSSSVVADLDDLESEYVSFDGVLTDDFGGAGVGNSSVPFSTVGYPTGDLGLVLRVPTDLLDEVDLTNGCNVSFAGPMWRFGAVAQPMVFDAGAVAIRTCPAPTVVSAVALDTFTVLVSFDRQLDPLTVQAADFTFDNGLTSTAVVAGGNEVTVTTTEQVETDYTVTVTAVNDTLGTIINPTMNNAAFTGFSGFLPQLYISEIDADQIATDASEFVEIWNNTGASVNFAVEGWYLVFINGSDTLTYEINGVAQPSIRLVGTLPDQGTVLVGNSGVVPSPHITFPDNSLQNGEDGVLLVRCDSCVGETDFPNDFDVGTGPTFTTPSGATATKIDGIVYETNDAANQTLMDKVGVAVQFNEDAAGSKDTDSQTRVSVYSFVTGLPTPGSH